MTNGQVAAGFPVDVKAGQGLGTNVWDSVSGFWANQCHLEVYSREMSPTPWSGRTLD
jgi:hypothetical protein